MPDLFEDRIYEYIVIGSGFGGSVAAMRLAQKGFRVAVVEAGRRWSADDFPRTNWNLRRYLWWPLISCYGIQRISLLRHFMLLGGAGVGGGSLNYGNILFEPRDQFYRSEVIQRLGGRSALKPYYKIASKMLGLVENPDLEEIDDCLRETANEMGCGETFRPTPVGVFFGTPDEVVSDPYFDGEGPPRQGCNFCGGCMVGCRFNAKNTLDKNYLYFAEKLGALIIPETKVVDIIPLSPGGLTGYELHCWSTTSGWRGRRFKMRTGGIVVAAGVLGTVNLLLDQKEKGHLSALSDALGRRVRTNSEALIAARSRKGDVDYSRGIAITSSVHLDDQTHVQPVRYSRDSDVMGLLATVLTDGGGSIPRPVRFLGNVLRHPLDFLRTLYPFDFARRAFILLVMQTVDNSLRLVRRRRFPLFWRKKITSSYEEGTSAPPTYIPAAHAFLRRMARKLNAIPMSSVGEVLLDIPTTAHILGGAGMGHRPQDGVIDVRNRVFGYRNMYICDGSMIPENLGVNPSLSIVALTERAMSFIAPKRKQKFFRFEERWRITGTLLGGGNGRRPGSGVSPVPEKSPGSASKKTGRKKRKARNRGAR